jgi:RES domain-containing protein
MPPSAPARIHAIPISGAWSRLHNANASVLDALLTAGEADAVARRLGLAGPKAPIWIPGTAGPHGGRFAPPDGHGALYLGNDLSTCLAEVIHHHDLFCSSTPGTARGMHSSFRHLVFQVKGTMADASRHGTALRHPTDYAPSWDFGRRVRAARLDGVRYPSVRMAGGACLAVFQNHAVRFDRVDLGAVILEWDGAKSVRIA